MFVEALMSYRAVLRLAGPGFVSVGFLARLPYTTTALASLILLESVTESYTFAGLAVAAQSLATAVSGPIVGSLADRHGLRRIGLATAAANALAVTGLLAATQASHGAMFAAAVLVGLTQPQVGPLVRVHWTRVARPGMLPTALSYETAADETAFIVGPALVGLLTPITPLAPMTATAVLLVGATLPFARWYDPSTVPRPDRAAKPAATLPVRPLVAMALAMAALGTVFGAVQTGVTAYADASDRPGAAGLLYALLGIGSAIAGVACGWLP
jgi:MFS family permease